jgi:lipoprotein-releasing system ATP-binding protein
MSDIPAESPVILEATGVAKAYATPEGLIPVLRGIELTLRRGQSVSIRGESGAGKTTLLHVLAGLEACDSGTVAWDGESLARRGAARLACWRGDFLGLVFQAYCLVPELTAFENVLLARRLVGRADQAARKRAKALLERVGLGSRLTHTPAKLSGGECQRVALARALMNKPRLILADEPTGNLDEVTAEDVMGLLLQLCREENVSLLLVTHNPAFAARTDRAFFLHHGQLADRREDPVNIQP